MIAVCQGRDRLLAHILYSRLGSWKYTTEGGEKMKKTIAILLSLVLMFAFTTAALAASVTGEVMALDANAKSLTVKGPKKGEVALTVNDKTKIVEGTEKKNLADISVGDKVSVTYTEAAGKNTASKIEIKASAEEKAAPAEKKAPAAKKTPGY
jgi:hypothetical protein